MQLKDEFTKWASLVVEVICDFLFLLMWLTLAWVAHQWLTRMFPLQGLAYYVGYIIELLLNASTLLKLVRLRFVAGEEPSGR